MYQSYQNPVEIIRLSSFFVLHTPCTTSVFTHEHLRPRAICSAPREVIPLILVLDFRLSSMQCQQGGGDDAAGASLDGAGLRGGGDRGGDSVGIESDGGGSERASAGGKGGREDSGETEDRREFCEFYPFLNDAPHNEMDGEAR